MKVLIVVLSSVCLVGLFAVMAQANGRNRQDELQWKSFKSKFHKSYPSGEEDFKRKAIFLENKRMIEEHNGKLADELGYQLGLNQFSDLTASEMAKLVNAGRKKELPAMEEPSQLASEFMRRLVDVKVEDLPKQVDWRTVPNRVGPVKNSGLCGADWAFAITGLLEGQQVNHNFSKLIPLSEEQLIDCSPSNPKDPCDMIGDMFNGLHDLKGIESEQDYPYISHRGWHNQTCKHNQSKSLMKVAGYERTDREIDTLLKLLAVYGPVGAQIEAEAYLMKYKNGIMRDDWCSGGDEPNFSVLVVGYGTDVRHGDYWIIKGMWGPEWGENGFFRLRRQKFHDPCQVAQYALIPIFA